MLKGSTDRSVEFLALNADGTPKTDLTSATAGLALWYHREGAAIANLTESDLSALTDAHSDGGLLHKANGVYRLDLPDAAWATGARDVSWGGGFTGGVIVGGRAELTDHDIETVGAAESRRELWSGTLSGIASGTFTLPGGHGIDPRARVLIELRSGTAAKGRQRYAVHSGSGEVFNVDPAWDSDSETMPSGTITAVIYAVAKEPTADRPQVDVVEVNGSAAPALVGGRFDAHIGSIADAVLTAAKFAAGAFDAVWSVTVRLLTGGDNIVLAKGTGVTGFTDLDAAGVRSAVGLGNANLDTQLGDLPTNAELAAGLAAADDAMLSALSAVASSLSALGTAIGDVPTNSELATALAAADDAVLAAIALLPNAAAIADAVHDEVVDGVRTHRQSIRLLNSAIGGKATGLNTNTPTYRDLADTKDRIAAVTDASGNRSAVTLDLD